MLGSAFILSICLIITWTDFASCGKCPPAELIEPCRCKHNNIITCVTQESFDLKKVFEYTTRNIQWYERKFHRFHLESPAITELGENTFADITFEEMIINAINLTRIHRNAFTATRLSLKKLFIYNVPSLVNSPPYYDIFDALGSMVNLQKLAIFNENITEIPSHAFRPLNGNQWNLTQVFLYGNTQSVGNYAFYDFDYHLKSIHLGSRINYIQKHAFDFRRASFIHVTIDLSNNNLNESSFEEGVFTNSKRSLYINLANNQITRLEEKVFKPFLEKDIMNQINLEGNPLVCDCHVKWMLDSKDQIKNQILNARCKNEILLWDHTIDELEKCSTGLSDKVNEQIYVNSI